MNNQNNISILINRPDKGISLILNEDNCLIYHNSPAAIEAHCPIINSPGFAATLRAIHTNSLATYGIGYTILYETYNYQFHTAPPQEITDNDPVNEKCERTIDDMVDMLSSVDYLVNCCYSTSHGSSV